MTNEVYAREADALEMERQRREERDELERSKHEALAEDEGERDRGN